MINTRVHNHGPDEGPGIACVERVLDRRDHDGFLGKLIRRGQCLEDDGCSRGAHDSGTPVKRSAGCLERPVLGKLNERTHCPHVLELDAHEMPPHLGLSHQCRVSTAIAHDTHVCGCARTWTVDEPGRLELEATPRRASLVAVLTDMMAVLDAELDDLAEVRRTTDRQIASDAELDDLAEVRRTTDRQIASDAEHVIDKLNVVWAKIAEARTAVRSCDLGYLPLPEVP